MKLKLNTFTAPVPADKLAQAMRMGARLDDECETLHVHVLTYADGIPLVLRTHKGETLLAHDERPFEWTEDTFADIAWEFVRGDARAFGAA